MAQGSGGYIPDQSPFPYMEERWDNIDAAKWTALPGVLDYPYGLGANNGWTISQPGFIAGTVGAGLGIRLASVRNWSINPTSAHPGLNTYYLYNHLHLEFEVPYMFPLSFTNTNAADSFFGLTAGQTDTRATSSGLIGWGLDANTRQFVGILKAGAGSEYIVGPFAAQRQIFQVFYKFGLDIMPNQVDFYFNGKQVASKNLSNISTSGQFLNFYWAANALGGSACSIGYVRIWYSS